MIDVEQVYEYVQLKIETTGIYMEQGSEEGKL